MCINQICNFRFKIKFSVTCILLAMLLVSGLLVSGCSTIKPEVKANLDAPVNCQTARSDVALLEEEKASVGKQVLSGVRMIMPIAAVAGLLTGDYRNRVQVTTGQYNADIEAKIAKIKSRCGLK